MPTKNINFEKYKTGLNWMDIQHAELIDMTLELINAIQEKRFDRSISGMLEFLDRYVVKHFLIEDDYMRKFDFSDLDSHLAEHNEFVSTLDNMTREFKLNGSSNYLSGNVKRYLLDWLVNHIGGSDRSLAAFLLENGVQENPSSQEGVSQSSLELQMEAEKKSV